jgi:predicted SnoaL-like aldol condensation-catalyzing enzyme
MAPSRKQQVIGLLKSLETKDPVLLAYVNPNKYIQHNLQVGPGPAGVAALIKNMPPDASVNTIRVFEDGNYVFAHTQYNFFGPTMQGADADAARVRALAAYKDFLTLWKDADSEIPILKEAKAEYAKLQ